MTILSTNAKHFARRAFFKNTPVRFQNDFQQLVELMNESHSNYLSTTRRYA